MSLLAHAVLLAICATVLLSEPADELIEIVSGWSAPPAPEPVVPFPEPIRLTDRAARAATAPPTPPTASPAPVLRPVDVSQVFAHRRPRSALDPLDAADHLTVQAGVARALNWLLRQQQEDGRWRLTGPYDDAGTIETDSGATALALLALLGDDASLSPGPRRTAIDRGLNWLIGQQDAAGDLFDRDEQGLEPHLYTQALGVLALCEAALLLDAPPAGLREAAQRGVAFLVQAQNPRQGGWRYRPLNESGVGDLSVSSWALLALHTARAAEFNVPPETFELADRFLLSVQEDSSDSAGAAIFRYRPDEPSQVEQRWSMAAAGLLSRQWLGWTPEHPPARATTDWLLSEAMRPEWSAGRRNVYAWYLTAQVLHNTGGAAAEDWQREVSELLLAEQATSGRNAGSWHPTRPPGAFLEWSHGAGRLYFTVLCTLILETPTRRAAVSTAP